MSQYIGRFAPSPTGPIHIGNLFSALIVWVRAKQHNGRAYIRLEDVDRHRSDDHFLDETLKTLRRFGLEFSAWEDDKHMRQSTRGVFYEEALSRISLQTEIFACVCSRKDIRMAGAAPQLGDALQKSYPGTCRHRQLPHDKQAAIRLWCTKHEIEVIDRVWGQKNTNLIDNFVAPVLKRKGGDWGYHIAVVVDDIAQSITEVVRGVDLLESATLHNYLFQLLGAVPPVYAHHPVLVDCHGERLAKRKGSLSVEDMLSHGQTLGQILRRLARAIFAEEPKRIEGLKMIAEADVLQYIVSHMTVRHLNRECIVWESVE